MIARRAAIALSIVGAMRLAGCSRSPGPTDARPAASPAATSEKTPAAESRAETEASVDPQHPETKWIGTIPYDVFFDHPLTVAADTTAATPVTAIAPGSVESPARPDATSTTPPPSEVSSESPLAAAGEIDWSAVAPMNFLVDEVKQIRVRLERNLQKISDFNKNVKAVSRDGAVLAAIAGVVERSPEEVNWKKKAANIRDLANAIYMKAEGSGSKPFNAAKKPFEDVKRLLDGESATEKATPKAPFAEFADRGELMNVLSETYNSLKSNVNSADRLKEDQEKVHKDLAVMTMLMTVMGDPSYDRADDPRYGVFVQTIVAQQQAANDAAAAGNFDDFSSIIGKINITCNECHMLFRTASE